MSYCPYSEWEVEGGNFYLLLMELGQQLLLFYALVASLLHSSVGQWGMLAWLSYKQVLSCFQQHFLREKV